MPSIAIILNSSSGAGAPEEEIKKLLEQPENSIFHLAYFDPQNIKSLIQQLAADGYEVITVAGGDGTISAVAGAIVEAKLEIKLGVVPAGTFNHFAKDLGLPLSIRDALEVIKKGDSTHVDIARVNDIYFLNNSSLGIYPKIVKEREKIRSKGFSKGWSFITAAFRILRMDNSLSIEFESEDKKMHRTTPFVLVGNNKYEFSGLDVGGRKRLDEGVLSICMAKEVSKLKLFAFGLKALAGTLLQDKDFNVIGLKNLTITSRAGLMDVSHDGEISKMQSPLEYKILPKALNVIIPTVVSQ